MVRSGEDFLELVWSAREEGVIGRPNQCFACSGAPQGGIWSAQGCKVGTNREHGRGGKWGGDSSELTGTQTSIIREQPGAGSGDEQGAGRGGKWGRGNSMGRMVANSLHSPAGSALTPQGGKWGRSGNAPGWKVGAPRGSALTPGHSAYAPGHSAYAPGHSTRQQVGHTPITMRTAGHDHGYKSDTTPAQHAKTRLRPEVTSTIHDTVFDLWTTQAQGRTYNAHSQNPGFQIRAKLSDGPALANDAPDPQGNSPKNSAGASPSSSEKEPHCLSAKRSRTTHRRPSK